MDSGSKFKKDKLKKQIRAVGFSSLLKGVIRSEVATHSTARLTDKKILIVDDEIEICETVREILSIVTSDIEISHHAKDALEKINKGTYDLFILDIQMPAFNGLQLLKQLRSKNVETPVLFLSASTSEQNLQNALDLKASAFIEKPFDAQELVNCVTSLIEYGSIINKSKKLQAS